MPDNISAENIEIEDFDDDDFKPEDFGFIIGPDGELKSIIIPENFIDDPPEEVEKILRIFGIESLDEIGTRTLH